MCQPGPLCSSLLHYNSPMHNLKKNEVLCSQKMLTTKVLHSSALICIFKVEQANRVKSKFLLSYCDPLVRKAQTVSTYVLQFDKTIINKTLFARKYRDLDLAYITCCTVKNNHEYSLESVFYKSLIPPFLHLPRCIEIVPVHSCSTLCVLKHS